MLVALGVAFVLCAGIALTLVRKTGLRMLRFVTVMSTVPADPEGKSWMVISESLPTVKHRAVGVLPHGTVVMAVVPTATDVAPVNNVPVRTTWLPPATTPAFGESPLTAGIGSYVYWSAGEIGLVPSGVVTTMSTAPTACAGMSWTVS